MSTITKTSISQHKLRRFAELKAMAAEFEVLKKEITAELLEGADVQDGRLAALVQEVATTSTAWKKEFIALEGDEKAREISARDKGNSVRRTLVVSG